MSNLTFDQCIELIKSGKDLPEDFDQWDLKDENGITVKRGALCEVLSIDTFRLITDMNLTKDSY